MRYLPHPKQLAVHHAKDKKRFILNWGRQVGKTVLATNYTWIEATRNQGRYFIVFPTYQNAYDALWSQYIGFIPKGLIKAIDKQRLIITLHHVEGPIKLPWGETVQVKHNPDYPPSTIELKGSDLETAERLRGSRVHGMVLDEYRYHNPTKWPEVFEPMLATTDGWAMFISSPQGFNHFYNLWNYAQKHPDDWFSSHATVYDNPAISREWIEKKKKEYEELGQTNAFYQEYMAEFRQMEGLVYRSWDRDVHVVDPDKVPSTGTHIAGLDFGFTNPTGVVFVLVDHDDNWWIYDEIYEKERTIPQISQMIHDKMGSNRLTMLVADSAQPESIAQLSQFKLPVLPVSKAGSDESARETSIRMIADRLRPREQLEGKPKPKLYISRNCTNFIWEIEQYRRPPAREGKNQKESPIKVNNHLMDATEYLIRTYRTAQGKIPPIRKPKIFSAGGFYR